MGWWSSQDGSGVIGDRPADIFEVALVRNLGTRFDVDLFGGFVAAFGGALLRNPDELVSDPPEAGTAIVAEFAERPPLVVPIAAGVVTTSLDDEVFDALESAVFHYREGGPERLPRLAELLETLAFAARGQLVDDDGTPLRLRRMRARHPSDDPDWRRSMATLIRSGGTPDDALAAFVRRVAIPAVSVGLRDDDRRVLLALRDVVAARARGVALELPAHPDPEIAARRAALLADVEAAVDGTALPGPDSPAYVLRAIVDPDGVRAAGGAPPQWRRWLARD